MTNKNYSRAAKRRLSKLSDEARKAIAASSKQPVVDNKSRIQRAKKKLPGNMGQETVH